MKKILLSFLLLMMLVSATACFGNEKPKDETPPNPIVEDEKDMIKDAKDEAGKIMDNTKDAADKALKDGTVMP